MNKIQVTLWVNAEKIDVQDNKIMCIKGSFYYNNKKYNIINGERKERKNENTIHNDKRGVSSSD